LNYYDEKTKAIIITFLFFCKCDQYTFTDYGRSPPGPEYTMRRRNVQ